MTCHWSKTNNDTSRSSNQASNLMRALPRPSHNVSDSSPDAPIRTDGLRVRGRSNQSLGHIWKTLGMKPCLNMIWILNRTRLTECLLVVPRLETSSDLRPKTQVHSRCDGAR